MTRLKDELAEAEALKEDIPRFGSDKVGVTRRNGQYWIHSWDLINAGLHHRLGPNDLITVGKQTFEVCAYVDAKRSYRVRPFSFELSEADLRELTRVV